MAKVTCIIQDVDKDGNPIDDLSEDIVGCTFDIKTIPEGQLLVSEVKKSDALQHFGAILRVIHERVQSVDISKLDGTDKLKKGEIK